MYVLYIYIHYIHHICPINLLSNPHDLHFVIFTSAMCDVTRVAMGTGYYGRPVDRPMERKVVAVGVRDSERLFNLRIYMYMYIDR